MFSTTKKMLRGTLPALATAALLGGAQLHAQFQADYGGAGNEFGRTGVMQTAAGLWAATGEAPGAVDPSDIYVVVANFFPPTPFFEKTYNIGGADYGKDIDQVIESDGTINYVITGYTVDQNNPSGSRNNVFILKIDQFGNFIWCKTYAGSAAISNDLDDQGYDIKVLADRSMVVVGRSNSNHPTHYGAIMFKVDPAGTLQWGKQWDGLNSQIDYFWSVDVASDGNLIASGATNEGGDADIFVAKASVATGAKFGFANRYGIGGGSNEGARCVRQGLAGGANATNIILAGNTGIGTSDALAVRINSTTGVWVSGARIAAGGWEEAMGVVEGSDGQINMTGLVDSPAGGFGSYDLYLQQLTPFLANVWYRLQGGSGNDQGWSINTAVPYATGPGVGPYTLIACGLKTIGAGNQQLYLTRTDWNGTTDPCPYATVVPANTGVTWTGIDMPAPINWGIKYNNTASTVEYVRDENSCTGPSWRPERKSDDISLDQSPNGGVSTYVGIDSSLINNKVSGVANYDAMDAAMSAYPNPVKRGESFTIGYNGTGAADVAIMVSDVTGKVVYSEGAKRRAAGDHISVGTSGWSTGAYLVQATIGDRKITRQIVVTE